MRSKVVCKVVVKISDFGCGSGRGMHRCIARVNWRVGSSSGHRPNEGEVAIGTAATCRIYGAAIGIHLLLEKLQGHVGGVPNYGRKHGMRKGE